MSSVFSNEHLFAFMDIAPLNKGHVLIVPKKHYPTMFEVPPEIGTELLKTMQILGKAIMQATNAGGLMLFKTTTSCGASGISCTLAFSTTL